ALVGVEPVGDRQAQHAIAEEFEPLVIARLAGAAVGQRLGPQRLVRDRKSQCLEPSARRRWKRAQIPCPMRLQRAAVNQVHGLIQLACPSVEKNMKLARPARLSTGTRPTPCSAAAGKRLSIELSRLSPIRNRRPAGTVTGAVLSGSMFHALFAPIAPKSSTS